MKLLTASEVPLAKIFSSDYEFKIPDYQRPYSWGKEQALQLLEDLVDALDRAGEEPYFLGSIVLVKDPARAEAEVIDGQQRLTTLTILISVLRRLTDNDALAVDLGKMLVEPGNLVMGLQQRPRITLRSRDAGYFRAAVQSDAPSTAGQLSPPANDAQKAITANTEALREQLQSWDEQRRLNLVQLLGNRTFLVVVSTPDLTSAHRIFSVMNSRGLDLTPADIFKAQIIGALPTAVSEEYADKWETSEEELEREAFSELFLHLRTIFSKERARRELLREFPEQVLSSFLPDQAKEFVDDVLLPYADAYDDILRQSYQAAAGAEKVNTWLKRLNQIENNDWHPPALWAMRHHRHDPDWLANFLKKLERLAASQLIRRTYATFRVSRYLQLVRELDEGQGLSSTAFDLSDQEKSETLDALDGELYTLTRVRKYVLLRLDEMLANNPGVVYDHPIITVEHVLPQTPATDSEWRRLFTDEERAFWTHRLGNLLLLNRAKNSEAQNYDFDVKKERYFTGSHGVVTFALTTQVLGQGTWTPSTLQARQADLIQLIRSGWELA